MNSTFNPLISIVVKCKNNEWELVRCLDSLGNQLYKNIEIILLDFSSSDGSLDIAVKYQKDGFPITILNYWQDFLIDIFPSDCLSSMRGKYFMSMNADSWFAPDLVGKCVNILRDNPEVSFVAYNWCTVSEDGSFLPEAPIREKDCVLPGNELVHDLLKLSPLCCHTSFALMPTTLRGPDLYKIQLKSSLEGNVAYLSEPLFYYMPVAHREKLGFDDSWHRIVRLIDVKLSFLTSCYEIYDLPGCQESSDEVFSRLARLCLKLSGEFAEAGNRCASERLGYQAVAIDPDVLQTEKFAELKDLWGRQGHTIQ